MSRTISVAKEGKKVIYNPEVIEGIRGEIERSGGYDEG
jgi:hypothetical protein